MAIRDGQSARSPLVGAGERWAKVVGPDVIDRCILATVLPESPHIDQMTVPVSAGKEEASADDFRDRVQDPQRVPAQVHVFAPILMSESLRQR